MKVSKQQMAENRGRILSQAARLFRDKGFESVSVAEVMKAAGLTHGGFYGHFASKDDLIAQAIAHALVTPEAALGKGFAAGMERYLSTAHRDAPAQGCPTAAFAADARRQTPAARDAMAEGLQAQIERIAEMLAVDGRTPGRRAAIGSWSAAVGALILARALEDEALSAEILDETRQWLLERTGA